MPAGRGTLAGEGKGAVLGREYREAVVVESSVGAKKGADSAALETLGQALELVAGQVQQGRYAPRRRSLGALLGDLPGMMGGALVPAGVAALGLGALHTFGPFGLGSGLLLWTALAFSGWWLAFLAVERVGDRIAGRWGEGRSERRRAAFRELAPHRNTFLACYALIYLVGGGLMKGAFGPGAEIGLALALYLGVPCFLLAPWLAARGLARARFGGEDPGRAAMQGLFEGGFAPLTVLPNYLTEMSVRSAAGLGWVRRVPSMGSLDLLTLGSPLVHGLAMGALLVTFEGGFFSGLPVFVGLGALHVQHELAVLAETAAGVEAREAGLLKELLEDEA